MSTISSWQLQQMFNQEQYLYTALFCEENIWQLVKKLMLQGIEHEKIWVLFITNPAHKIALLNQQAAAANKTIIWDYHVVLLTEITQEYFIFDFDTRLSFISPVKEYLQSTLINPEKLPQELIAYIRKVPAKSYLERFYSDRSHMVNQVKPSEFPSWPMINAHQKQSIKLARYLDIEQDNNDGSMIFKVSSIEKLQQWLVEN